MAKINGDSNDNTLDGTSKGDTIEGFDPNGDQGTTGVGVNDVKFTNNGDGTWKIEFVNPATQ